MGNDRQEIEVWDTATGTLQQTIHSKVYGNELAFSDDGNYLQTTQGSYKLTSGVLASLLDPELSQQLCILVRMGNGYLEVTRNFSGCPLSTEVVQLLWSRIQLY